MEGKFCVLAESKHKFTVGTLYVISDDGGCLLSSETAQKVGLVSLHLNQVNNPKAPSKLTPPTNDKNLAHILDKHAPVFRGLEKLKNKQVELVINETVSPLAQPQRLTPFHLRRKVEDEIYRLERTTIPEGEFQRIRFRTPWLYQNVMMKFDCMWICG